MSYWCPKMDCYVYFGQMPFGQMPLPPFDGDMLHPPSPADKAIKQAMKAEEVVSDLLNFGLVPIYDDTGALQNLKEGVHEIRLKFRQKAQAENTDSLIKGRTQMG